LCAGIRVAPYYALYYANSRVRFLYQFWSVPTFTQERGDFGRSRK
jgi:hypothetical protein